MKWYECAGIGVVMACLYGITLWASVQVRDSYLMIYQRYGAYLQENVTILEMGTFPKLSGLVMPTFDERVLLLPYIIPPIITAFSFTLLFSVPLWYPYAEKWFGGFSKDIIAGWNGEREDDEEDDEE